VFDRSAALTSFHLHRRWTRFVKYLPDFAPAMTTSGFIRLIIMVVVLMVSGVVLTSLTLWNETLDEYGFDPATDWASIHSNISHIQIVPAAVMGPVLYKWTIAFEWVPPIASLVVFLLFSSTKDVLIEYYAGWSWFSRVVLRRQVDEPKPSVPEMYVLLKLVSLSFSHLFIS
jgi:hypothetical protein